MIAMNTSPRDPRVDPQPGDRIQHPNFGGFAEHTVTHVTEDRIYYVVDPANGDFGQDMMMRTAWKEWAKNARVMDPDMRYA